jgi:hypothetical protein
MIRPISGPGVSLAMTKDFKTLERFGIIMSSEDKDAALITAEDWRALGAHSFRSIRSRYHGAMGPETSIGVAAFSAPRSVRTRCQRAGSCLVSMGSERSA